MAHLGNLMKERRYTGIEAIQVLINITLAAWDNSFPFHPEILFMILSTKGLFASVGFNPAGIINV
jgi:hypothetical protein